MEHHDNIIVRFTEGTQTWEWKEWLQNIAGAGCLRLMLVQGTNISSVWTTSSFSGGGRMMGIAACGASNHSIWLPEWQLDREHVKTRWNVTYTKVPFEEQNVTLAGSVSLSELSSSLQVVLHHISQLAEEIGEGFWKKGFFDPSLTMLVGKEPVQNVPFHLPAVYSEDACRLLYAVYKAWVFGGMGSWNDEPPYSAHLHKKELEYEQYSKQLYETLLTCAQGAVNSVNSGTT